MNPSQPSKRRRREFQLAPEVLESREMLTGGIGDTFAVIPGSVSKAGQITAIKFTIDPAHFTIPKGQLTLGLDVAAQSGSTVNAQIVGLTGPNGQAVPVTHGRYAPNLPSGGALAGTPTTSVLAPVHFNAKNPNASVTYTVKVRSVKGTTGAFIVGFYLPGNASGSGTVSQADLTTIQGEMGINANNAKYTFDADSNRDGRITATDLSVAKKNLGASVTITPTLTSDLDAAGQTLPNDRILTVPSAHFTGTVTPGATVTYVNSAAGSVPVTATADKLGAYSILMPLNPGSNVFNVTTMDAFGQSIDGTLTAVTYQVPKTT